MKVLVIQQRYGIGDMVIFTPYLHAICKKYNTPVSLLAKETSKAKDLFAEDKHIGEIINLDHSNDGISGFFSLVKELKSKNFNKVFIFNGSLRYYLAVKLAGIKDIAQYPLFKKKDIIFKSAHQFVENLIREKISTQPKLILSDKTLLEAKKKYNFDSNFKHIILGISASGPTKRWDIKNYFKLAEDLSSIRKCKFYLACGENDFELEKIFLNSKINTNCFSLSSFKIKEILPIIKNADLYLGNDTGFLHISAALGLKSLGIFCDSPAYSYSAYSDNIKVIVPEGETISSTTHNTLGKNQISFLKVWDKTNQLLTN